MTFIYELDPHLIKMYKQTKNKLSTSTLSKVIVLRIQTYSHRNYYDAAERLVKNK